VGFVSNRGEQDNIDKWLLYFHHDTIQVPVLLDYNTEQVNTNTRYKKV